MNLTLPMTTWIEHHPDVCGGDARIRGTRIPVWGIIESKRMGWSDERILECYPSLTLDDLRMAEWYYETHKDEIEQALREEEEAWNEDGSALRG